MLMRMRGLFTHYIFRYMRDQHFNTQGYVSVSKYLRAFDDFRKRNTWKIPLGAGDRVHLLLLFLFEKISWLKDALYIKNEFRVPPPYAAIIGYLKQNGVVDEVIEEPVMISGYYKFKAQKVLSVNGKTRTVHAAGVGSSEEVALSKALGEIIERVVAGYSDKNKTACIASYDTLNKTGKQAYYPPAFHRYDEKAIKLYKELRTSSSDVIEWMKGRNLHTNKTTYIPKQLVRWMGLYTQVSSERSLCNASTNGSALYFSEEKALQKGIFECIERDAFLLHWVAQVSPYYLLPSTLPESAQRMIFEFKQKGVDIVVLECSTDIKVPTVCVVATSVHHKGGVRVITAGAAFTLEDAVDSALKEMVACVGNVTLSPLEERVVRAIGSSGDELFSVGQWERIRLWRGEEWLKKCEWMLTGEQVTFQDRSESVMWKEEMTSAGLVKHLSQLGATYEPCVYRPKHPMLTRLGVVVVQVFIPALVPFYLQEKYRAHDSLRVRSFMKKHGIPFENRNTLPHMFP